MKNILFFFLILSMSVFTIFSQQAIPEEAIEMINKAHDYIMEHGLDEAIEAFNDKDGDFVEGDLYIFVVNFDGMTLAHGADHSEIGQNRMELKDAEGRYFIRKLIKQAKEGSGWVDYKWENPITKEAMPKSTYVKRIRDIDALIGCGIYKEDLQIQRIE